MATNVNKNNNNTSNDIVLVGWLSEYRSGAVLGTNLERRYIAVNRRVGCLSCYLTDARDAPVKGSYYFSDVTACAVASYESGFLDGFGLSLQGVSDEEEYVREMKFVAESEAIRNSWVEVINNVLAYKASQPIGVSALGGSKLSSISPSPSGNNVNTTSLSSTVAVTVADAEMIEKRSGIMYEESEVPIDFVNAHILDQLGDAAFFKKEKRETLPAFWKCSKPGDKIRLHAFVSFMNVMNIDPIGEKFDVKFRLYLLWKIGLDQLTSLGLQEFAAKALASGNFYSLSRAEYDRVESSMTIPVPTVSNKITEDSSELADIRCYGGSDKGTAFLWNKAFSMTCRERFELHNFPFDTQNLNLEFRLNDARTWDLYDLTVVSVQFHKQALVQTEWAAYGPHIKRDSPAHKVTHVQLKFRRLSWYYVQNIAIAMLFISSLALLAFVMDISDLGSRVSTCLTVVLTVVAFKFVVTSSIPKVPYNTSIDFYINASSGILIIISYLSVIPHVVDSNGAKFGTAESLNRLLGYLSIALVFLPFIGWIIMTSIVAWSHNVTKEIVVQESKNWYSFRFSTPDFLLPPAEKVILKQVNKKVSK